jgi:hypothetical protein
LVVVGVPELAPVAEADKLKMSRSGKSWCSENVFNIEKD